MLGGLPATTCSAQGLSLAVNGLAADAAPTLAAEPGELLSLNLQVVNTTDVATQFSSAQAAIFIRPIAGATGEVVINLSAVPSVFGLPTTGIPGPTDGVLAVQAGGFSPATLAEGARASLAQLDLPLLADASGDFELIALEFDPLNLLRSSQWLPPLGSVVQPPVAAAFGNALVVPSDGLLLATLSIPSVPEPIAAVACFGIALRRRGSWR